VPKNGDFAAYMINLNTNKKLGPLPCGPVSVLSHIALCVKFP